MWGRCGPNLRRVLVRLMGGGLCVNPHGTCLRGTVSTSPYSLGSKAGPGAGGGGGYAEDAWCVCARAGVCTPVCLCAVPACVVVGAVHA